jgi:hypothetical protein
METKMNQKSRMAILAKKRDCYACAGKEHNPKNHQRGGRIFNCPARRPKEDAPDKLRAPLDRLLIPTRIAPRHRATPRPGTLVRHQIPICIEWTENQAGVLAKRVNNPFALLREVARQMKVIEASRRRVAA